LTEPRWANIRILIVWIKLYLWFYLQSGLVTGKLSKINIEVKLIKNKANCFIYYQAFITFHGRGVIWDRPMASLTGII